MLRFQGFRLRSSTANLQRSLAPVAGVTKSTKSTNTPQTHRSQTNTKYRYTPKTEYIMPTGTSVPFQQDWGSVNVGRGSGVTKKPTTARGISLAKSQGKLATEKRYGAGGNASAHSSTIMSSKKLEEATDVGKIAKVDASLRKAIMQARTAKKMTQKELATAINEKPQVVAEYESGKAVPNPQIISKLERKLGVKLPRPGKSKPPPKAGAGAKKTGATAAARAGITRGGPPKRR